MIAVVDYGVDNLRSVVRALAAAGHTATLTTDPAAVRAADHVVLPGVGHFTQGVRNLAQAGLDAAVIDAAAAGRPVLGICLGLQLMFAESDEAPDARGLGLLPGRVQRFATTLPLPHVGWTPVQLTPRGSAHAGLRSAFGDAAERHFYHVHSYHPAHVPPEAVLATADYGGPFVAIAGRGTVLGVQFHPEKSQQAGIALLGAFAQWRP